MSPTGEKAVWSLLGVGSALVGTLSLMILDNITESIHDLRHTQQELTSRIVALERIVDERTERGISPPGPSPQKAH